jgi:putative toxin-antitoxin system antitoxin component (TIGR02293 family)
MWSYQMITVEPGEKGKIHSETRKMFRPQPEKRTLSDDELRAQKQLVVKIIFNRKPHAREEGVDVVRSIIEGFPASSVSRLVEYLNIRQNEMLRLLHITSATFSRRRKQGKLESVESDRVYRYTRLAALATEMFHGDGEAARHWLKSPAYAFKGETPLAHAQTEYGAREVENLIGRIQHGIPS